MAHARQSTPILLALLATACGVDTPTAIPSTGSSVQYIQLKNGNELRFASGREVTEVDGTRVQLSWPDGSGPMWVGWTEVAAYQ